MKFVDTLPPVNTQPNRIEKNHNLVRRCQENAGKWTIIQSYDVSDNKQGAAYMYANSINKGVIKSLAGLRAAVRRDGNKFHVWAQFPVEGQ